MSAERVSPRRHLPPPPLRRTRDRRAGTRPADHPDRHRIANPATPTQTSSSSRQAPDSLFPEVGSSRYNVKHYAIKLTYQTSGEIKAKTTLIAKTKKPLRSFSLDLEGLTVDTVKVNGHTADFSRRDNKLIIKPSKVSGRPLLGHDQVPRKAGHPHRP